MAKDDRLIARVASLYYIDDLTQVQIADRLDLSRQMVGRMLKSARESGLIQIRLNPRPWLFPEVEKILEQRFGLKEAVVVPCNNSRDDSSIKTALGQAAAEYLALHVHDNTTLGISWGTTMARVADFLTPNPHRGVRVVQLNGGVTQGPRTMNIGAILHEFSAAFGAKGYSLNAPAIVDTARIQQAISSDSAVSQTLELANQAEVSLFSIGALGNLSVVVEAGYLSPPVVARLQKLGGVGDICSRYFDAQGNLVDQDMDDRTIGISLDRLGSKKYAIAVAGGPDKIDAIRGALARHYCNVLVTDEATANQLLATLAVGVPS
jgi:deoxyribonucleoside regulator